MIISFPVQKKRNLFWKDANNDFGQHLQQMYISKSNLHITFNNLPYNRIENTFIVYWNQNNTPLISLVNNQRNAPLFINSNNHKITIRFFFVRKNKFSQTFTQSISINNTILRNTKSKTKQPKIKTKSTKSTKLPKSPKLCDSALSNDCSLGNQEDGIVENSGLPYQHSIDMPLPIGF